MLSKDQEKAQKKILTFMLDSDSTSMILSGHSGSGKSYLTSGLTKAIKTQAKVFKVLKPNSSGEIDIHYTATTHQAAKVLSNVVGETAGTIHSLLGLKLKKDYKTGSEYLVKTSKTTVLKNCLIIVDEASMVNKQLKELIDQLTINCKVLYIGDSYQLLPVNSKDSPVFDCKLAEARLTSIQRQHKDSSIISLGKQLRASVGDKGNTFPDMASHSGDVQNLTGSEFQKELEESFIRGKGDPYANRFLAWENIRVNQINKHVHKLLTNKEEFDIGEYVITNKSIVRNDSVIYQTDTVHKITGISNISTMNPYQIPGRFIQLNDCIEVLLPEHQYQVKQLMKTHARDKNWTSYFSVRDSFVDLRSVYASTVHKSQGSTYNNVFIDLENIGKCHQREAVARMLYVAVTRAKEKVLLYGELPNKYRA